MSHAAPAPVGGPTSTSLPAGRRRRARGGTRLLGRARRGCVSVHEPEAGAARRRRGRVPRGPASADAAPLRAQIREASLARLPRRDG